MSKKPNPHAKVPVCVTLDPTVLARISARSGNRSEEINSCLSRLILIEEGLESMTPTERRRLKALAIAGTFHEKLDRQRKQEPKREKPKPVSPWPT